MPATGIEDRSSDSYLLEVLKATRDVLVSLANQIGYLPQQGGYSTTMTDAEMKAAHAVADIDSIISRESQAQEQK